MINKKYDASSIEILEGLKAVRKRPGMYIGSLDSKGLHHMVFEIVDNAIDEAINGYGDKITIEINKDHSITVSDKGRGMPVDHHESGKSALEIIFTVLHAGGKFSDKAGYKTAGGLHGVGASVVNALSKKVVVKVYRDKTAYAMEFSDGGSISSGLKVLGKTNKQGSEVTFYPDDTLFSDINFNFQTIVDKAREKAFLLSGITMEVIDHRNSKSEVFKYDNGINDFVAYLCEDKKKIGNIIDFKSTKDDIKVAIAMQYSEGYHEELYSFVNMVRTKDGGTHESGLKSGLNKAFNDYIKSNSNIKEKINFEGSDIREGLSLVIAVNIPEYLLQFEGQTKSRLGTPIVKNIVDNLIANQFLFYLNEHPDFALRLYHKVKEAYDARMAARKAREESRKAKKKNNKSDKILSGKLAKAQLKDPKKLELFLVEGDSAGGSAKQGRDSKFQAILPLRGKVINSMKAKLSDIEKNEELNTLIHAIGCSIGSDFNLEDINYNKIIIMTDADTDGAHIQILLLTFFFTYMRKLIEKGYIYIARPPLFKLSKNKELYYAFDEVELNELKAKIGKCEIQRYKGLGEMNADQLWETTMDPKTRSLIKVSIEDLKDLEKEITIIMGDKAELRREWIEENVKFSLVDDYR